MKLHASFVAVLLLCTASHADQIRNRYTHRVMRVSKQLELSVSIPGKNVANADWIYLEKHPNMGSICMFQSRHLCLTAHGKSVTLAQWSGQKSQLWRLEAVPDTIFSRIGSVVSPGAYINIETGSLELSPIKPGWWSAMWAFDEEPAHDARSVHLWYDDMTNAADAYIEAKVVESHPSSYFMTLGFNGGYFGIQELTGKYCDKAFDKQIIFSLWNEDGSPEHNPRKDALAQVLKLGPGVKTRAFGGEGAGAQTYKCLQWAVNDIYRFYLHARVDGRYTVYTAYLRGPKEATWSFIAELRRPTRGILIDDVYSFVEDFGRTGVASGVSKKHRTPYYRRAADFLNPWFKRPKGPWTPATSVRFTAYGTDHPQTNIRAGTVDANGIGFRLETGGTVRLGAPLNSTIESTATPTQAPATP